jgi:hypothetical protein
MASMTRCRRPQEPELTANILQHSVAMDREDRLFGQDSKRFSAIFSREGTFLDIHERLLMLGPRGNPLPARSQCTLSGALLVPRI